MFTLEIAGRPIAVIGADEEEARDIVESEAFQADLRRLLHDATPLWDGEATLALRPATEEEIADFQSGEDDEEDADEEGEEDGGEDDEDDEDALEVMFLVPINDPDEEG
ncbi:hypothetical protein CR162_09445 [Pseudoroseomonas rhizosphaerae]|uniref:Glutamine amidotransferase n=1 Tax=Teichococcus rhizosphaerae TaxID=1335062 RepID=A0A2C7ADI4_9PROT|nr:hypothetical protein [Pseudoroseomonas rhizosphaerae]PHK95176.1 hypothetical protein CR162_09445 [Pseudoroseomonas rhizosphaerae]